MNKMRDDQDFNINFVQIVKQEPCLYDKTLAEYRNKDEHERIWLKIANEVNESAIHCKERWRNLRACLTRHLKNKQKHKNDSSAYHKPYYLAEYMEFLLPFTKTRSKNEKQSNDLGESNDFVDFKEKNESRLETDLNAELLSSTSLDIIGETVTAEDTPKNTQQHGIKREISLVQSDEFTELEIKRQRIGERTETKQLDDADWIFLKSLLPDIRQMTASQKRKFKGGIFQLISNILDNSD